MAHSIIWVVDHILIIDDFDFPDIWINYMKKIIGIVTFRKNILLSFRNEIRLQYN